MKVRQHRGGYAESMETLVEIEPTLAALKYFVRETLDLTEVELIVEPYGDGIDKRNGWETHIIIIVGIGVFGFCDSPLAAD